MARDDTDHSRFQVLARIVCSWCSRHWLEPGGVGRRCCVWFWQPDWGWGKRWNGWCREPGRFYINPASNARAVQPFRSGGIPPGIFPWNNYHKRKDIQFQQVCAFLPLMVKRLVWGLKPTRWKWMMLINPVNYWLEWRKCRCGCQYE